jgi:hypothetical protein
MSAYAVLFVVFGMDAALAGRPLGLVPELADGSRALAMSACAWQAIKDASAAWRLDLTPRSLRWRSGFRSGEIPLAELRRVRLRWDGFAVIESAGRRRLLINVSIRDQQRFAADVEEAAPHIEMKLPQRHGHPTRQLRP